MAPARRASSRWLATRDERDPCFSSWRIDGRDESRLRPLASGVAQSSMPSGSRPSSYTPRKRSSSVCTSALSSAAPRAITHLATFEPRSADFVWSDLKKPVPAGFGNSMIRSSGSSW